MNEPKEQTLGWDKVPFSSGKINNLLREGEKWKSPYHPRVSRADQVSQGIPRAVLRRTDDRSAWAGGKFLFLSSSEPIFPSYLMRFLGRFTAVAFLLEDV